MRSFTSLEQESLESSSGSVRKKLFVDRTTGPVALSNTFFEQSQEPTFSVASTHAYVHSQHFDSISFFCPLLFDALFQFSRQQIFTGERKNFERKIGEKLF
jgi:hypothetical protein